MSHNSLPSSKGTLLASYHPSFSHSPSPSSNQSQPQHHHPLLQLRYAPILTYPAGPNGAIVLPTSSLVTNSHTDPHTRKPCESAHLELIPPSPPPPRRRQLSRSSISA